MKCCASPITSTAADSARETARDVMNAILFREILKPLVRGLGPVAEIALGSVTDDLFVRRPRR
ncbi:MAG: hypothetical protein QOF71_324 [Candidatus Eremiobacteraeota bacterium]|nr:hypothetical protein [Candidatus Eremiobacteraeota bacterium]